VPDAGKVMRSVDAKVITTGIRVYAFQPSVFGQRWISQPRHNPEMLPGEICNAKGLGHREDIVS